MAALTGQVALVTGAGSGIGRATALHLAREGAQVVVTGRRVVPLEAVVNEIVAAGGRAVARPADLLERDALRALVQSIEAELGRIDILVNNAGAASRVRNILFVQPDDWQETISVNLNVVYTLIQAVLPGMIERCGGTVVTVSSLAAVRPGLLGGAPYGAAKAAVANLMSFVHASFRNQSIRATTILPGEVNTPIMDTRVRPPTAQERARTVDPDDVARAIVCAAPCRHARPSSNSSSARPSRATRGRTWRSAAGWGRHRVGRGDPSLELGGPVSPLPESAGRQTLNNERDHS